MNVNVSIDKVEIQESKEKVHKGEYNVNKCIFSFSNEYTSNLVSIAVFTNINGTYKKDILDNKCEIPSEVLEEKGLVDLGVYSYELDENGSLRLRYSPSSTKFIVESGSYKEAKNGETPSVSEFDKYIYAFNKNADIKTREYNDNALLETNKFNTIADARKQEIDAVSKEVSKNKTDIEEIERRVKTSEQNAKASETNAKTSEQNAQNSLNRVTEIETNITSIQEDINASKVHIDEQKRSIDKSVENVERLVEEATQQANVSKANADLSTTNAEQVSADKNAVENMKNEVFYMKTSVEQTKADAEQIKEETEQAKNETLEAKENVENSLETERNESDKKYARAIETDEIVIDGDGQVELDEDGYMKEFSAEGNLPEITQDIRQGYNKVKGFVSEGIYNGTLENDVFTSVSLNGYGNARTRFESLTLEANKTYYASVDCRALNNSYNNAINILLYYLTGENEYGTKRGTVVQSSTITNEYQRTAMQFDIEEEIEVSGFLIQTANATDAVIELTNPMISELNLDYEPFGVSPSLEFPSEFQNVVNSIDIFNSGKNILNLNEHINALSNNITILDNNSYSTTYTDSVKWQGIFRFRFENLQKNKDYVISLDFSNNGEPYVVVTGDGETIIEKYMSYYPNGLTFNTNNYKRIQITIYANGNMSKSNTTITLSNIQLEQGKVKTDFTPFLFSDKYNIELSKGQFLGNFQGFKNYIKNDKLKGRLKILTLTGDENWQFNTTKEKTQVFQWYLGGSMVNSIGICSHLKFNAPGDSEKCIVSNKSVYLAINKLTASTVEELKALLAQKYQEGNPVKVLYITTEEFEKDLSLENKSKINSLRVYKGTNNICSNSKIRFKANKNLKNELDKCVKNTDYATNNKSGLIKGRATHGFNIDSSGAPYLSTYDEEYKDLPDSSFVSTGTLKKVEDKILSTSNNKYAKALKDSVVDKNFAQIYADISKINNLVLKGEQLEQETHISTDNILYSEEKYWEVGSLDGLTGQPIEKSTRLRTKEFMAINELTDYYCSLENSNYVFVNIHYYNLNKAWITAQQSISDNINEHQNQSFTTPENANFFKLVIKKVDETDINLSDVSIARPMLVKGMSKIEYIEGYPVMPSLEYPSEIEAINAINLSNVKENLIDASGIDKILGTLRIVSQEDGSIKYSGIPAGTWTSLKTINLKTPIKAGTEIIMSYGLNEELKRDNGFNPFLWLLNKNGDSFGTVNKYNIISQKPVKLEQDVYKLVLGIQDLVMDQEYEGQMYIELERTNIMPTEFHKYQTMDYSVNLPEGHFNGAIGDNYNEIKKIDGKWCLVKYIKELILDGTENWGRQTTNVGKRFSLDLNEAMVSNSNKSPTALCTHFSLGKDGSTWSELNLFVIYQLDNFRRLAFGSFDNINEISEWKAILQEQKEKGTPIIVCYTLVEPEIIELPEETQQKLNSIELMEDLNNISIDNGTISFEYNKPLYKAFEEIQQENINLKTNLQAQIDEIKKLLSTPSTASMLAENLAKDNESEVI